MILKFNDNEDDDIVAGEKEERESVSSACSCTIDALQSGKEHWGESVWNEYGKEIPNRPMMPSSALRL